MTATPTPNAIQNIGEKVVFSDVTGGPRQHIRLFKTAVDFQLAQTFALHFLDQFDEGLMRLV